MEMSVGQVAKRSGVSVATLHFYEQKGLISSTRNNGNQRRYSRQILRRVAVIKAAQKVGLSLEDIKQSLGCLPTHAAPSKEEWQQMANQWNDLLEAKINTLNQLKDGLDSCINCGCLSLGVCQLFNPDDSFGENNHGSKLSSNAME